MTKLHRFAPGFAACLFPFWAILPAHAQAANCFELSFPAAAHAQPITGRVFVIITRTDKVEPRIQLLSEGAPPFFGKDVSQLQPNQSVTIDNTTAGYPLQSLKDLPAGDYYVEAFLNIYTEFHRADGHTIWAHLDWVGELPSLVPASDKRGGRGRF